MHRIIGAPRLLGSGTEQVVRNTVLRRQGLHARRTESPVLRVISAGIRGVPRAVGGRRTVQHDHGSSLS